MGCRCRVAVRSARQWWGRHRRRRAAELVPRRRDFRSSSQEDWREPYCRTLKPHCQPDSLMARNHARVLTSIWNDPDFVDLSPGAQRMYLLLLSQQNLSHAGLLPLTVTRWANQSASTTPEQLMKWLSELVATRFVLIDHDTEELLVRSLIRGDEVYKQPQVMASAAKDARAVASPMLAWALAVEVARIRQIPGLHTTSVRHLEDLAADLPDPDTTLVAACEQPGEQSQGKGMVTKVPTVSPSPTPTPAPSPATSATPPRADVESMCAELAGHIVANGSKRPEITGRWRDAARLMIDRDERPFREAMGLIAWCQSDPFWRANVLSMVSFRDKYDQIRLQRERGQPGVKPSTTDARVAQGLALVQHYEAKERQEITQ